MIKRLYLLSMLLPAILMAEPSTPGALSVLFETAPPGGRFGNLNVHAVWVEKADGTFVKTLDSWGSKHAKQLKDWKAADKNWKVHARTAATQTLYGTYITRWDATDASGRPLPDGDYVIRLELTNDNIDRDKFHRAAIPFPKTAQPCTIGALNQNGYKQIILAWRPGKLKKPLPKSTASPLQKDPNMILDELNSALLYSQFSERITKALALLSDDNVRSAPVGKHEVDGADLFFSVDEYQTKPFEDGRPEIHQEYLDIQYIVSGTECIGFCPLEGLELDQPYDAQKDIAFYKYAPEMTKLVLNPGMFAIFWPSEPHMPQRAAGLPQTVRKIVVKVRMK